MRTRNRAEMWRRSEEMRDAARAALSWPPNQLHRRWQFLHPHNCCKLALMDVMSSVVTRRGFFEKSELKAELLQNVTLHLLIDTVRGSGDQELTSRRRGLLWNPRKHTSQDYERRGRDDFPVCQLWVSKVRPGLDPQAGEYVCPSLFPSPAFHKQGEVEVFRRQSGQSPMGCSAGLFHHQTPNPNWKPILWWSFGVCLILITKSQKVGPILSIWHFL